MLRPGSKVLRRTLENPPSRIHIERREIEAGRLLFSCAQRPYPDSLVERTAREHLAPIRGNQAWALALPGHAAESQQAIEAGAREMEPEYTPEVAGFYWARQHGHAGARKRRRHLFPPCREAGP